MFNVIAGHLAPLQLLPFGVIGTTQVGQVSIKELRVGDEIPVMSNRSPSRFGTGKVVEVLKIPAPPELIMIDLNHPDEEDPRKWRRYPSIICNPGQSIYTPQGWKPAQQITRGQQVELLRERPVNPSTRIWPSLPNWVEIKSWTVKWVVVIDAVNNAERYQRVCPDGVLYSLVMEGQHNFPADSFILQDPLGPELDAEELKRLLATR